MASNKTLAKAKEDKNDEYYTQLSDIENELKHYRQHFKDKIILPSTASSYTHSYPVARSQAPDTSRWPRCGWGSR